MLTRSPRPLSIGTQNFTRRSNSMTHPEDNPNPRATSSGHNFVASVMKVGMTLNTEDNTSHTSFRKRLDGGNASGDARKSTAVPSEQVMDVTVFQQFCACFEDQTLEKGNNHLAALSHIGSSRLDILSQLRGMFYTSPPRAYPCQAFISFLNQAGMLTSFASRIF
jgi:hypothetical protein